MKNFLTRLINRPGTPHVLLFHLFWWFVITFAMWADDGCLWTNPPFC